MQSRLLVSQYCGHWAELETDAAKAVLHSAPGTAISQLHQGLVPRRQGSLCPQMLVLVSSGSAHSYRCDMIHFKHP